jgi:cytochrome c1
MKKVTRLLLVASVAALGVGGFNACTDDVSVVERESFAMVEQDGQPVARWESRAALVADAAAYPFLAENVTGWDELDLRDRGQLLNGARVFAEECPLCDGEVGFSEDTVESCCREIDVVAMECTDCESLLLEVEV